MPEIRSLGRTLKHWRGEILAHHAAGASNGPTEAMNLLVKQIKRCGHGFKSYCHFMATRESVRRDGAFTSTVTRFNHEDNLWLEVVPGLVEVEMTRSEVGSRGSRTTAMRKGVPVGEKRGGILGHPSVRHQHRQPIGGQSARWGGGSNPYGADAIVTPASARTL